MVENGVPEEVAVEVPVMETTEPDVPKMVRQRSDQSVMALAQQILEMTRNAKHHHDQLAPRIRFTMRSVDGESENYNPPPLPAGSSELLQILHEVFIDIERLHHGLQRANNRCEL